MATFDDATTVHGGDGRYTADIDPMWTIGGNPHGGYLLAMLARAAIAEAAAPGDAPAHPHPLAVSAAFLTVATPGPATVAVEVLRRGKLATHARAQLRQGDKPHVEAIFTLGRLELDAAADWVDTPPAQVAPFEECHRSAIEPYGSGIRIAMLGMVDQRLDLGSLGSRDPNADDPFDGGSGEVRGWLRFEDDTPFDPISLLYAADSFPSATFTLGDVGWVPTVTLSTYVRAIPAPGPLRLRQRVRILATSLADQVCDVWDSTGQIVAQAVQLDAVRR